MIQLDFRKLRSRPRARFDNTIVYKNMADNTLKMSEKCRCDDLFQMGKELISIFINVVM